MKKLLFLFTLTLFHHFYGFGQDLLSELPEEKPQKEYVSAVFKGTRLINGHTTEICGKRTLDFRINHRFGELSSGFENLYGLDGPASIMMNFDYSFDGRFMFGFGRSSIGKLYNGLLKYKLLRQSADESMPVSLTGFTMANITVQTDKNKVANGYDKYEFFSSRMSFVNQILISRKFSKAFSLQLMPTMVHHNLVEKKTDKNDIYSLGIAGRLKMTSRAAITWEYYHRLNKYSENFDSYKSSASIGFDLETGGHVFQMFVSNAFATNEAMFIPYTTGDWTKGQIRLGFNISRVFTL